MKRTAWPSSTTPCGSRKAMARTASAPISTRAGGTCAPRTRPRSPSSDSACYWGSVSSRAPRSSSARLTRSKKESARSPGGSRCTRSWSLAAAWYCWPSSCWPGAHLAAEVRRPRRRRRCGSFRRGWSQLPSISISARGMVTRLQRSCRSGSWFSAYRRLWPSCSGGVSVAGADVHPKTEYARSGELHIAYQVVGSGTLDLVYVPGWVSHVDLAWEEPMLARFLARLASFSRLITFDKRGTGLSYRAPQARAALARGSAWTTSGPSWTPRGPSVPRFSAFSEGGNLSTDFRRNLPGAHARPDHVRHVCQAHPIAPTTPGRRPSKSASNFTKTSRAIGPSLA